MRDAMSTSGDEGKIKTMQYSLKNDEMDKGKCWSDRIITTLKMFVFYTRSEFWI